MMNNLLAARPGTRWFSHSIIIATLIMTMESGCSVLNGPGVTPGTDGKVVSMPDSSRASMPDASPISMPDASPISMPDASLVDFIFTYTITVNSVEVTELHVNDVSVIDISVINASGITASGLWATAITFPNSDCANECDGIYTAWIDPLVDSEYCGYETSTGFVDCKGAAESIDASYNNNFMVAPGAHSSQFLRIANLLTLQPQQIPITFQFDATTGQSADGQITLNVVP